MKSEIHIAKLVLEEKTKRRAATVCMTRVDAEVAYFNVVDWTSCLHQEICMHFSCFWSF